MKILVVPQYSEFGGTQAFLRRLLLTLRKQQHEIAVLVDEHSRFPHLLKFFENNDVLKIPTCARSRLGRIPYLSILSERSTLRKAIEFFGPELIFVSSGTPRWMLGALAERRPVVYFLHTYPFRRFRPNMLLWSAFFSRRPGRIFATVSRAAARIIHKRMAVPEERIYVVPNSADLPVHTTELPRPERDSTTVLTLGHCTKYKGFDLWRKVAERICATHPHARFVWIGGEGDSPKRVGHLSQSIHSDRIVVRRSPHEDQEWKIRELSKAAVYFQPSRVESQGIAVLEAMEMGLPCVTSDAGGLPESVVQGETGYICHAENVEEYVSKIERLLAEPALRDRLGSAGRARAKEKFSIEKQDRLIAELIRAAMADTERQK